MTSAPPTAGEADAPAGRRPDAMHSLLGDLVGNGLDEGYLMRAQEKAARAAAASEAAPPPPTGDAPTADTPPPGGTVSAAPGSTGGPRRHASIAVVACLVLAGLLLATAASQTRRRAPDTAAARDELVQEVAARDRVADRLEADIDALERDIEQARRQALRADRTGAQLSSDLDDLGISAGTVAVRGPGVRVLVDDASGGGSGGDDSRGGRIDSDRVSDRDLQDLVNSLWAAGAEAVAIDGIRLTSRSAIRAAGEAVLVDFRPATPPYVLEAIGNPDRLPERFAETAVAQRFELWRTTYGIGFEVRAVKDLTLRSAALPSLRAASPGATP